MADRPEPGPGYVAVAVNTRLDRPLTYRWSLETPPQIGLRVNVPLKGRRASGFVVGLRHAPPPDLPPNRIRPVASAPDDEPLFPAEMMPLFEWLAGYYRHPLGQTMAAALPLGADQTSAPRRAKLVRAVETAEAPELPPVQGRVYEHLKDRDWLPLALVRKLIKGADSAVRGLARKGLIELADRGKGLLEGDRPPSAEIPEPTPEQAAALGQIEAALAGGEFKPYLLHGVTGSGKTEVYLRAAATALEGGRSAMILVPEIALTPRLEALVRGRFGPTAAVLHSGLTPAQRRDQWLRLLHGRARVVLGARSAVFAPLTDLGLIVVDEEHEPSYKQDDGLRYHARDVALVRGREAGAVVVLGSATPSVVSHQHRLDGKYGGLDLPHRIHHRPLAQVEVVDLRGLKTDDTAPPVLSPPLVLAMEETLAQGRQALIFLNRRGFATYPVCGRCGQPLTCPNCSVSLVYHRGYGAFMCHYCGRAVAEGDCPTCGPGQMKLLGLGTERLEEEVKAQFPQARVARLDSDVAAGLKPIEDTLARLALGQIDILVGTQMLAKGHDFPGISLVGVVLADLGLSLPDFRAAERAFQLLTQVAGRAGRGETPGRVIVQTMNPNHYAIRAAMAQDFEAFYQEEIGYRRHLFYPPFCRLIQLRLSDTSKEGIRLAARRLTDLTRRTAQELKHGGRLSVLGPAPSPLAKVAGRYRWLVLIKAQTAALGQALLDRLQPKIAADKDLARIDIRIDVDPMSLL